MPETTANDDMTLWLRRWSDGDDEALARLLPAAYDELRRIAARALYGERRGHTLQPTALVHEAYLRLAALRRIPWRDRGHFYGAAARTMRRLLVEHARRRGAAKRGGPGLAPPPVVWPAVDPRSVLAVDLALHRLAEVEPAAAEVVELKVFAGLTLAETAAAIGCSAATVSRRWALARAWLYREVTAR